MNTQKHKTKGKGQIKYAVKFFDAELVKLTTIKDFKTKEEAFEYIRKRKIPFLLVYAYCSKCRAQSLVG